MHRAGTLAGVLIMLLAVPAFAQPNVVGADVHFDLLLAGLDDFL